MNISNINKLLTAYQSSVSSGKIPSGEASFIQYLQNGNVEKPTGSEAYTEYLKSRYGKVTVQAVDKDQRSMDALGAGTSGTGNVVIAPNILERMAADPEKAAYYEGKIQHYFQSVPKYQAELSAMGHEIHSSGIIIHPDGTVTHYITGDLKPEERARIEAQVKAEQEGKAKRRKQFQEQRQEAEEQRFLLNQYNQKLMLMESMRDQKTDTANIYLVNRLQTVSPPGTAYEPAGSMAGRFYL